LRKRDEVVLWPVYFDLTKTRSGGRKVPKRLARPSPTLGMIEKALADSGLAYRVVSDAAHPSSAWKKTGLILVRKVKPRKQILQDIAERLSILSV